MLLALPLLSGCGSCLNPFNRLSDCPKLIPVAWISGQQAEPIGTFPYCEPGTITDDSDYENVRCLAVILET